MDTPNTDDSRRAALRRQAEKRLQEAEMTMDPQSYDDAKPLLHELHIHQIELTLQNEELRETQIALEQARRKYADLYDFAPVGYFTLAQDGAIRESNLTAAAQLGVERAALLNTRLYQYVAEADRDVLFGHLRRTFAAEICQTCELRLCKTDGTCFWGQVQSVVVAPDMTPPHDGPACRTTITDISARKQAEEHLQQMLAEREALIKEVNHRVKNNFSSAASLLSLQASVAEHPETRAALYESHGRILSMAAIHEQLCQADNLTDINVSECLDRIAISLCHAHQAAGAGVTLSTRLTPPVFLTAKHALPCALIINELVTNALKYAFPEGRAGGLRVALAEHDGRVILAVSDNGVGLPPELDIEQSSSLGLRLVQGFVLGLRGTLNVSREGGAAFTVTFPR